MSCEIVRCCMFEPIHGREPYAEMCANHPDCIGCAYCYDKLKEE